MESRRLIAWWCALWLMGPVLAAAQPPDDEPVIQAALDAAYQAGGGTVTLPAGVYHIRRSLVLRSNVWLKGAGIGSTTIRGTSPLGGKNADGAEIYAAIGMVGADQAGVSDLTLDLFTNRVWTNGIALLPTGAGWTGTPTTRSFVERVHIMGGGNYHAYMIWNLRGRHNKILNNIVDGGVPTYTSSAQEGIEVFGGADILISGNTVRNVGRACINIVSAYGGGADTSLVGLTTVNNNMEACGVGIYLSPVLNAELGPQNLTQIQVRNNVLRRIWLAGIVGTVAYGGRMDFVEIVGNSITGVGVQGQHGRGIWIEGVGGAASSVLSIRGNVIADVTGFWGFGIYVVRYPGVSMGENRIIRSGHSGILVVEAEDADVRANRIMQATHHATWVWRGARAIVRDNTIYEWDTAAARSAGVLVQTCEWGLVAGNVFIRAAGEPEPHPVEVDAGSIQSVVTQNKVLYRTSLAQPFLNASQPGRSED